MSEPDNLPVPVRDDVSVFNDGGVLYMTGGEQTQEYLWMDDIPSRFENTC